MTLFPDERTSIVKYRLEKAFNLIKEAKDIGGIGYWNTAAPPLYYSAYHANSALLIQNGIEASTHKGVMRMIGDKFVKTAQLSKSDSTLLGRLFSMRQTGDYDDSFEWDKEDIAPLIPVVEAYVHA